MTSEEDSPAASDHLTRAGYVALDELEILALRRFITHAVASVFQVPKCDLRQATRGRSGTAFARQVAMYLTHVCCGVSLTEVGRIFERDRTTVAHACVVVEDRCDDPNFDLALDFLEGTIRQSSHLSPLPSHVVAAAA